MPPPLPRCSRWAYSSLVSPNRVSLPRFHCRIGLHIVRFEVCSAFTHVAACTLALSPIRDTLIEGFSHFVTSMTAPIASGGSESPGGTCTHWKAPPSHGAHPFPTFHPTYEIETPATPGPECGFMVGILERRRLVLLVLETSLHAGSCGRLPLAVGANRATRFPDVELSPLTFCLTYLSTKRNCIKIY